MHLEELVDLIVIQRSRDASECPAQLRQSLPVDGPGAVVYVTMLLPPYYPLELAKPQDDP